MGTAKIDWDASWTDDTTIGATITDTNTDESADYSVDDSMMFEFAVDIDYGGTYDEPAIVYVQRKLSTADYEDQDNAHMAIPVNGAVSAAGRKVFTVGPDVNTFRIQIKNDSGATITVDLDYKQGHIITA